MEWSIKRASEICRITNSIDEFSFRGYELLDPAGAPKIVLVVFLGEPADRMLVRLNSACITGELFGDKGCDCGWQFITALQMISKEKSGMMIYSPADEGRGSGICNKIDSIALMQKMGLKSSEAFRRLGLDLDSRDYGYASAILRHLGVRSIRCLTNNPLKIAALQLNGISVDSRIDLVIKDQPHLRELLRDKQSVFGQHIDI